MRNGTITLATLIALSFLMLGCTTSAERRAKMQAERKRHREDKQSFCKEPYIHSLKETDFRGAYFLASTIIFPTTMSTHTTQCKDGRPRRTSEFIGITHDNILADASRGGGEYLESLSELLELSANEKKVFLAEMRNNIEYLSNQNVQGFSNYVFELATQTKMQNR